MIRTFFILLIAFFIVGTCVYVFSQTQWIWAMNQAKRKGFFPKGGKPTMFHVRQLIQAGERELAILFYCLIFRVSYKKANQEVDDLERSMREKKP